MVTAHMDEVGLIVQHITPDGFIRVKILGGILEQALPDQRWTILGRNGPVPAVTGLRTTHVLPASQRGVVWSLDDTFLDVGATSQRTSSASAFVPATASRRSPSSSSSPTGAMPARRGTTASASAS